MEDLTHYFLGDKLREEILIRNVRTSAFAKELHVSRSRVYRWISGENTPTLAEYTYMLEYFRRSDFTHFIDTEKVRGHYKNGNAPKTAIGRPIGVKDAVTRSNRVRPGSVPPPTAIESMLKDRSKLFARFPRIADVSLSVELVRCPSLTEKSPDGFTCPFEIHVDRAYLKALRSANPETIPESEAIPRHVLLRPSGKYDEWGDVEYVFIDSGDVYDWKHWNLIDGIEIFIEEEAAGNKSVVEWLNSLRIDDGEGWYKAFYNLDEGLKIDSTNVIQEPVDEVAYDEEEAKRAIDELLDDDDDFKIDNAEDRKF